MKKVKCKFTYEVNVWMTDIEYEGIKEQADIGELEKDIKEHLDNMLLDDRSESSKITSFYFGVDKEWQ